MDKDGDDYQFALTLLSVCIQDTPQTSTNLAKKLKRRQTLPTPCTLSEKLLTNGETVKNCPKALTFEDRTKNLTN